VLLIVQATSEIEVIIHKLNLLILTVHPRQADYYRGDKHAHFFTAQIIVSLYGEIWDVNLGLGHNNDKAMLILTNTKQYLLDNNIKLLADKGYSFVNLITPTNIKSQSWNNYQKGLRSIVERAIGVATFWSINSTRVRLNPELHQMAIMITYQITAMSIKQFPICSSIEELNE